MDAGWPTSPRLRTWRQSFRDPAWVPAHTDLGCDWPVLSPMCGTHTPSTRTQHVHTRPWPPLPAGQTTSSLERHVQPVSVYCVEPSTRNFANLILTRDKFFSKDTPADVQWYIINTAMSNSTGMSHFPRGCKDELCSLQGNSDGTTERDYDFVPLSTLDDFFRTYELDSVDLMKVDTEGFDATVISGGMEVLSRHRVGVLAFEYHEVGVWREYSLRDIVDTLDGMNYVCYFDGGHGAGVGCLMAARGVGAFVLGWERGWERRKRGVVAPPPRCPGDCRQPNKLIHRQTRRAPTRP